MAIAKKIALVGMPGSGKSVLGKRLASLLGYPFLDLDEVIESQEGVKIKDIFRRQGEDQFRTVEHYALMSTLEKHPKFVLATGGGTPCFHDNMDIINGTCSSVFLDTPIEKIIRRLSQSQDRPLVQSTDPEGLSKEMEQLFQVRKPFYLMAHHTTSSPTPEAVMALLRK